MKTKWNIGLKWVRFIFDLLFLTKIVETYNKFSGMEKIQGLVNTLIFQVKLTVTDKYLFHRADFIYRNSVS